MPAVSETRKAVSVWHSVQCTNREAESVVRYKTMSAYCLPSTVFNLALLIESLNIVEYLSTDFVTTI